MRRQTLRRGVLVFVAVSAVGRSARGAPFRDLRVDPRAQVLGLVHRRTVTGKAARRLRRVADVGPSPPRRSLPRRSPRLVPVGRFFGVPIYFAPSWLLIAAFLTVYYGRLVQNAVDGISASSAYVLAFVYAVLFALCVLAHELGHTGMSLALHRPVKRVVIFLLGGISEIEREPDRPRDEFLISAAGPMVSAVITGVCALAVLALPAHSIVGVLFALLFWSNLVVLGFNLLPGLPLDGGRLLRAGVWAAAGSRLKGTRVGAISGRAFAVLVALTGLIADRTTLGVGAGLLSILLAMYMWVAAGQALRAAEIMDRVPTVDIERLLRPGLLVPSDISVAEALRRIWSGSARGLVLVDAQDHPAAIVDEAQIASVPPDRRPWTQLSTVARPLESGLVLPVGLAGEDLLDAVRRTPANEYLVVNTDGSPVGILSTIDLAAALRTTA
jgi:Zn-dependent protease